MEGGLIPSFLFPDKARFSQMNIFIIGGMSAIFFGLIATLMLLRKKDNSDIMSRRITVIII